MPNSVEHRNLMQFLAEVREHGLTPDSLANLNQQLGTTYSSSEEVVVALQSAIARADEDAAESAQVNFELGIPNLREFTYTSGGAADFQSTPDPVSGPLSRLSTLTGRTVSHGNWVQLPTSSELRLSDDSQPPDRDPFASLYNRRENRSNPTNSRIQEDEMAFDNLRKLPRAERKRRRIAAMEAFVMSSGLKGAESLIRCGLEFEFHKLNRPGSNVFDEPGFSRDLESTMQGYSLYSLVYHGKQYSDWTLTSEMPGEEVERRRFLLRVIEHIRAKETQKVEQLPQEMRKVGAEYEMLLRDRAREKWIRTNRRHYISAARAEDVLGWDQIASYTQMGTDGSVRGGEVRTLGGRTIREFLTAARVLSRNPFEVAEDTSFHIHLSLNDVEHKWGERFQAEMYAYLLKNVDRMPEAVQKRLVSPPGQKYAKFMLENGHKYVAVYKHDDYNTWEFRLFGNVSKFPEMVQCLTLAVDTLRHVYAVRLGLTDSLIQAYATDEIQHALNLVYDRKEPIEDDVPRENRYDEDGDLIEDPSNTVIVPGTGLRGFHQTLRDSIRKIRSVEEDAA